MYKQYYIYIMSNKTNSTLYIGVTNDLERRVVEHKSGQIPGFTQKYNCHKLVYFESFSDINQAIAREKQLKKWSRSKKDWLIDMMNKERVDLMEMEGDSSTSLGMTKEEV
ncbi:MAG: GIY-YIG nuclease family protein [Bacteroidales bacterium]|nr:GIY-YIG nuclease family protein [Bacteroidales bacterium]